MKHVDWIDVFVFLASAISASIVVSEFLELELYL